MDKDNNRIKESASIIEEIESQLQDVLEKRKKAVEQELEEKIRQAQEEASKRKSELESQLKDEQEALTNYKNVLSEFESNKESVKSEIKTHLDKAIQLQIEIEEKTALSLDELRSVSDLTQKLAGINMEAGEKVNALKAELEEKFGIVTQVPESIELDDTDFDLESELQKLQKIKELLGAPGSLREEDFDLKKKPGISPDGITEEDEPEEGSLEAEADTEAAATEPLEEADKTPPVEEQAEDIPGGEAETAPETPEPSPVTEEAPLPSEEFSTDFALSPELEQYKDNESVRKAFASLAKYRKSEPIEEGGEVIYYQKNGTMVLEGENLIIAVTDSIDKAKQLYIRLSETESPKEQFFIKQEIIKHQDNLRKVMLSNIRWSEKETCSLPKFTEEVFNPDSLKSILEKVSMENWSNKDDFSSFEDFVQNLKEEFYNLISPPDQYFESILDYLEKC